MPRELAEILYDAFPRLSQIAQQVGGKTSKDYSTPYRLYGIVKLLCSF